MEFEIYDGPSLWLIDILFFQQMVVEVLGRSFLIAIICWSIGGC